MPAIPTKDKFAFTIVSTLGLIGAIIVTALSINANRANIPAPQPAVNTAELQTDVIFGVLSVVPEQAPHPALTMYGSGINTASDFIPQDFTAIELRPQTPEYWIVFEAVGGDAVKDSSGQSLPTRFEIQVPQFLFDRFNRCGAVISTRALDGQEIAIVVAEKEIRQ